MQPLEIPAARGGRVLGFERLAEGFVAPDTRGQAVERGAQIETGSAY